MALVKYNNRSILNVTALDSVPSGGMNLITTNTISSGVSSSSFTSNIDSTYDTYMFKVVNVHPASDAVEFTFNLSTDGSNFNVTKTTVAFRALHDEGDSETSFVYQTGSDLAQSTGYQTLCHYVGNGGDECCVATIFLFNPSNTTFVKHFISRGNSYYANNKTSSDFISGYGNTTSAITAVDFKFSSGNIDSGVIKMYGLSKS